MCRGISCRIVFEKVSDIGMVSASGIPIDDSRDFHPTGVLKYPRILHAAEQLRRGG